MKSVRFISSRREMRGHKIDVKNQFLHFVAFYRVVVSQLIRVCNPKLQQKRQTLDLYAN